MPMLMLPYVIPLVAFSFGVALCMTYGTTNRTVLMLFALPMIALVGLRGDTGTDTAAYYTAFSGLDAGAWYGSEPFFHLVTEFLWLIEPDPRFVVNGISLLTATTLLWSIGGTRHGAWFGGLLIVPGMFYELTMNVLRFGLAASIFLIATSVPPREHPWRYFVLTVLGTCTHFSSILLFVLFVAITQRARAGPLALLSVGAFVGAIVLPGYLGDKAEFYTNLIAPNASTGLLFVILQAAMLATVARFHTDFAIPRGGFWVCLALTAAFYGLTRMSYAGIRFQLLLTFLMAVVLLRQYRPRTGRISSTLTACLLVIGLVALAGRFNNMLDEAGRGASPFMPYRMLPSLDAYG